MENPFEIVFLMLALMSGGVGIFFSYRIMHRYRIPYTSSYFYFMVFLYIFGAYSMAGSGLLENLMYRMEADPGSIHMARVFSILAGMPLLALAYFMWMRTTALLLDRKLWTPLGIAYLVAALTSISAYGYSGIRLTWFDKGSYDILMNVQWWVFAGVQLSVFAVSYFVIIIRSGNMVEHERMHIRRFGLMYLLYGVMSTLSFILGDLHLLIPFLFLFIFLAWHLVPILFLNNYLARYHGQAATMEENFDSSLEKFVARHEISKREQEVIVLLSKGLSNQEISEALFISLQTVKDHVHRIFIKTGVKNRIQLTNLIRSSDHQ